MAELVVMSGSSLSTFLRCPQQWNLAYVHRIKRPPRLKMAVGLAGHEAIEKDMDHRLQAWENLPREEVIDTFVDAFKEAARFSPEEPAKKSAKAETFDTSQASGIATLGVWYDTVAPDVYPLMVEQHGQFDIDGIPYDWTADLIDQDHKIHDWKFTGKKPSDGAQYVLNMVGYAIGYRELTGQVESGVQLDFMVRTQKPYHHIIEGPTVPAETIQSFADVVGTAYQSIQAGIFPATGLASGVCSWCPYNDGACPAYRKP